MVMIRTAPGELLSWRRSLQGLSRETDPFMGIRIRPPGSVRGRQQDATRDQQTKQLKTGTVPPRTGYHPHQAVASPRRGRTGAADGAGVEFGAGARTDPMVGVPSCSFQST